MANVTPKDIDVAEIHDAFSIMAVLSIEDLGFAEKGKAAYAIKEGIFENGESVYLNPSGGLKARGHPVGATGVYQIAEITNQLRGTAGKMQLNDVKIGLAQNIGGSGSSVTVAILKKE